MIGLALTSRTLRGAAARASPVSYSSLHPRIGASGDGFGDGDRRPGHQRDERVWLLRAADHKMTRWTSDQVLARHSWAISDRADGGPDP